MSSRDTITTEPAPGRFPRTGRYRIQRGPDCINCGKCIQLCVYGVHFRQPDDIRRMAEPDYDRCMNCFACVQDCTAGVLSMDLNPAFAEIGDALWRAESIDSVAVQAATGTLPVLGSGYGGAFAGNGFDGIWTDMSEIVRPTRDGIHGRETITTHVDLGRHPTDVLDLSFDDDGNPITAIPPTIEIKLPILFDRMPFMPRSDAVIGSICEAAGRLGTLAIVDLAWFGDVTLPPGNVVLDLGGRRIGERQLATLAGRGGVIELSADDETPALIRALRERNPYLFVFVRVA
ncbi:MAG: 4Fe-4S dicluster domain-containing protein, partial [Candidatus Eiseniibacteriota bacterium]